MILTRVSLAVVITLLTSCGSQPPAQQSALMAGPSPAVLFSNSDVIVKLTGFASKPNITSRCWLYVQIENISEQDQKKEFRILLLDKNGNSLKEGRLNFPTVLPKKSFAGVHYTFTDWTCAPISTVRLTPIER